MSFFPHTYECLSFVLRRSCAFLKIRRNKPWSFVSPSKSRWSALFQLEQLHWPYFSRMWSLSLNFPSDLYLLSSNTSFPPLIAISLTWWSSSHKVGGFSWLPHCLLWLHLIMNSTTTRVDFALNSLTPSLFSDSCNTKFEYFLLI